MFLLDENPVGVAGVRSMRLQIVNDTGQALSSGVTSGPKKLLGATVDWDTRHYRRHLRFNDDFHQGNVMHLGGMSACHASLYPWGCMGGAGVKTGPAAPAAGSRHLAEPRATPGLVVNLHSDVYPANVSYDGEVVSRSPDKLYVPA